METPISVRDDAYPDGGAADGAAVMMNVEPTVPPFAATVRWADVLADGPTTSSSLRLHAAATGDDVMISVHVWSDADGVIHHFETGAIKLDLGTENVWQMDPEALGIGPDL